MTARINENPAIVEPSPTDIPASNVNPHDGVGHGEALVDGHSMSYSVPWVKHHPGRSSRRISVNHHHGI